MLNFNFDFEVYLECSECGQRVFLEPMEGDWGYRCMDYKCRHCGYEGNFEEDMDEKNYFWDEALCNYDENDKGEVWDNI